MKLLFADTSFFLAYLDDADEKHAAAQEQMQHFRGRIVTTEWVLLEFDNSIGKSKQRRQLAPFLSALAADGRFLVVAAGSSDLHAGVQLYDRRSDKRWSLTDCISFEVMRSLPIASALTTDHHFRQAGFRVLL